MTVQKNLPIHSHLFYNRTRIINYEKAAIKILILLPFYTAFDRFKKFCNVKSTIIHLVCSRNRNRT